MDFKQHFIIRREMHFFNILLLKNLLSLFMRLLSTYKYKNKHVMFTSISLSLSHTHTLTHSLYTYFNNNELEQLITNPAKGNFLKERSDQKISVFKIIPKKLSIGISCLMLEIYPLDNIKNILVIEERVFLLEK